MLLYEARVHKPISAPNAHSYCQFVYSSIFSVELVITDVLLVEAQLFLIVVYNTSGYLDYVRRCVSSAANYVVNHRGRIEPGLMIFVKLSVLIVMF